jgi:hypothetical protein
MIDLRRQRSRGGGRNVRVVFKMVEAIVTVLIHDSNRCVIEWNEKPRAVKGASCS